MKPSSNPPLRPISAKIPPVDHRADRQPEADVDGGPIRTQKPPDDDQDHHNRAEDEGRRFRGLLLELEVYVNTETERGQVLLVAPQRRLRFPQPSLGLQ